MNIIKKILFKRFYKDIFKFVKAHWKQNGASDELMFILSFLCSDYAWQILSPEVWLIYICCLLERGEKASAIKIFNRYMHLYDLLLVESYLPVANLAVERGILSEKLETASKIFNKFEFARKNNVFKTFIEGKSVAIVGNGPQELGKKRGKEIDAHDIVIRFNFYPTEGYEEDYGSKTDIWVKNYETIEKCFQSKAPFVVLKIDPWHSKVDLEKIERSLDGIEKFDYLSLQNTILAQNYMGDILHAPTAGFFIITAIYDYFGSFNNIDFYGFSFLDNQDSHLNNHYYLEKKSKKINFDIPHRFQDECKVLTELCKKGVRAR